MRKNYAEMIRKDITNQLIECDSPTIHCTYETAKAIWPYEFKDTVLKTWLNEDNKVTGRIGNYEGIPIQTGRYDFLEVDITDCRR